MTDEHLRNQLIRLAHSRPEIRDEILPLVSRPKESSHSGMDMLQMATGGRLKLNKARVSVSKADPEAFEILGQSMIKLSKSLELPRNEQAAFGHLLTLCNDHSSMGPAQIRNAVFKIADLLKIKAPSSDF